MTKLPAFAVGNAVEVYFGCVFRTVFKDVTRRTVTIPIEYWAIPEEVGTVRVILLSSRTVGPEGLDIQTTAIPPRANQTRHQVRAS